MSSHQEIFEGKAPEQRRKRLHKERSHYKKKQKIQYIAGINLLGGQHISIKCHELGRIDQICVHCGAKFWIDERNHRSNQTSPSFSICCAGGKVILPPLLKPPSYLLDLYISSSSDVNYMVGRYLNS